MDTLQFHFDSSKFSKFKPQNFWNPQISWKNKWKNGDPNYGERFRFSSTFLVGFTDAWHLFKSIRNLGIFIFLPLGTFQFHNFHMIPLFILVSRIIYGVGFNLAYR
jgi:hypothetical protein